MKYLYLIQKSNQCPNHTQTSFNLHPNTLSLSLMHCLGIRLSLFPFQPPSVWSKLKLRGALCCQVVSLISREMFYGGKVTQSSPLILFSPEIGNWKWCVFLHITPCYFKCTGKISCTCCSSPALYGITLWDTAGIWIWQRPEYILHISKNLQPQALNRKDMYLLLITAICLFHFPSDTTKTH